MEEVSRFVFQQFQEPSSQALALQQKTTPAPLTKEELEEIRKYNPGPDDPMMHPRLAESQLGIDPLFRPASGFSPATPAGSPIHGPISLRDYDDYVGAGRRL